MLQVVCNESTACSFHRRSMGRRCSFSRFGVLWLFERSGFSPRDWGPHGAHWGLETKRWWSDDLPNWDVRIFGGQIPPSSYFVGSICDSIHWQRGCEVFNLQRNGDLTVFDGYGKDTSNVGNQSPFDMGRKGCLLFQSCRRPIEEESFGNGIRVGSNTYRRPYEVASRHSEASDIGEQRPTCPPSCCAVVKVVAFQFRGFQPKRIPHISACAKPIPILQTKGLQANNPEESDFIPSTSKNRMGKQRAMFRFSLFSVMSFICMFALYIHLIRYIQGILV